MNRLRSVLLLICLGAIAINSCVPTSSAPTPSASVTPTLDPSLRDLPVIDARLAGRELRLVLPPSFAQGLMRVTSLGDLDGMIFSYPEPRQPPAGMWMKDVRLPLDAAFFDADMRLIEVISMPLCDVDPCPVWGAKSPFQHVLEAPEGTLDWLRPGDLLELP